ncbi:hypothetical protein PF005_g14476 [Phytophthora fragariae]|uniref:Uncharacterized protein n=1 Tax=Phytophthora fragariae TaxID=53985 RepID=A0A6A3TMI9_9STRA|nr:hypothetical protein PF003_g14867 [Phytophthora fragariae]KAE8934251.1 hypothetical protein PF009_g15760 [Phytophthora fragariae]KAE9013379.1 hypothetical protein PF011_g8504 [Phytophthora fragariae]KAE9102623.1 hypothetical protein PF007_g14699 [Phytophthora fragariae]KAE9116312.1 hypothetical protein PF010_g8999 [Phytophthora fragariae]
MEVLASAPVIVDLVLQSSTLHIMALKSYHRETLNDNWYEERAAPLNGVLPRDGVKEYKTTTGTDFNGAQPIIPRQRSRMINDSNVDEAIRQTASLDWSRGFRSVLPVPDPEPDRGLISTQHRVFVNHFASSSQPSHTSTAGAMITAGGPGGRTVERGKAASGAMGEVYKKSSEPQKDTLAQRSWMYSTDPMILVMQKRAALEGTQAKTPPDLQQAKPENYGRQITSITSIRHHHKGVFVDDEPEHLQ